MSHSAQKKQLWEYQLICTFDLSISSFWDSVYVFPCTGFR